MLRFLQKRSHPLPEPAEACSQALQKQRPPESSPAEAGNTWPFISRSITASLDAIRTLLMQQAAADVAAGEQGGATAVHGVLVAYGRTHARERR